MLTVEVCGQSPVCAEEIAAQDAQPALRDEEVRVAMHNRAAVAHTIQGHPVV